MPEEEQEIGRLGAKRVKRLLEATLRFSLPYNAYQHKERVSLEMLTGHLGTYDLNGDVVDENGVATTRVFIESKNLDGAGSRQLVVPLGVLVRYRIADCPPHPGSWTR